MWNQRAQFDIAMRSSTNENPPQQIYVSCNFCGKSIAAFMQGLSRARAPFGRLGSTSNKSKASLPLHLHSQCSIATGKKFPPLSKSPLIVDVGMSELP